MSESHLTIPELVALLNGKDEHSLLDVRETGEHTQSPHILASVSAPLSRLEFVLPRLVPRKATRVVVYDGDGGVHAERAAERLQELGYRDTRILAGGMQAWLKAGHEGFTGDSVFSKAFGEYVHDTYHTPAISARALRQRLDCGEPTVVFDGRTLRDFEEGSLPGAWACPNAELALRVHDLIPSSDTLVVVNCAGRTRSIVGAQTLINAGLPNQVVSLENGTLNWLKEGFPLNKGLSNPAPAPGPKGRTEAKRAYARLVDRFKRTELDAAKLESFRSQSDRRTLYLLDVRTQTEFLAGHLPGSVWAEGGQLVQGIDKFCATRNARLVVIDDQPGVRAAVTAHWLTHMGWGEAYIYRLDPSDRLETGEAAIARPTVPEGLEWVSPQEIIEQRATVIDLADSRHYGQGHIPGAYFAIRVQLPEKLDDFDSARPLVVTSPNGVLAALAADDMRRLTGRTVQVLAGGTGGWVAAGNALETGSTRLLSPQIDLWVPPHHRADPIAAFDAYIEWELGLVAQLGNDPTVKFRTFEDA